MRVAIENDAQGGRANEADDRRREEQREGQPNDAAERRSSLRPLRLQKLLELVHGTDPSSGKRRSADGNRRFHSGGYYRLRPRVISNGLLRSGILTIDQSRIHGGRAVEARPDRRCELRSDGSGELGLTRRPHALDAPEDPEETARRFPTDACDLRQ